MHALMTMDDLVAAATAATESVAIDDARVASEITERTVRYYVTLGLVRPPVREGGRSLWTHDHVNDLIRIRRAQSLGQSLRDIARFRESPSADSWRRAGVARDLRTEPRPADTSREATGWCVHLGRGTTLSGFDIAVPGDRQLEQIRLILGLDA
ncbi:MAG: MerR family transcriptional regulator [Ilumatobacteraceae bacterium]